ncbi:MAG: pH regulation protein F [Candidatus Omnitrophica bacterium]|nr:pH regulation protein F [Candidatus Omnitrophota bacterium]
MTFLHLAALAAILALFPVFLYRAAKGPTIFDRLIGLNGIASKSILLLVLIGAVTGHTGMFIDLSLGYGLLNLVGALAIGKYLESKGARAR